MLRATKAQELYDKTSKFYNPRYRKIQFDKYNIALNDQILEGDILDLGSGTGLLSEFLGRRIHQVDISKGMLLFGKGRRVQADIENLPFKTDRFDYVLSFSALMNAENPEGAVKEVKRVLKPEGIFIVTYLKSFDFFDTLKRYFKLIDMRSCGEDVCFILKN